MYKKYLQTRRTMRNVYGEPQRKLLYKSLDGRFKLIHTYLYYIAGPEQILPFHKGN